MGLVHLESIRLRSIYTMGAGKTRDNKRKHCHNLTFIQYSNLSVRLFIHICSR